MLIALNNDRERIQPLKGSTGFCQQCGDPVKAYCGEIVIHHWKHQVDRNCDPWKEHESEWHRSWKSEFPVDWREVVIQKDGQKHIADVKTSAGLTLELQNSSISSATIREREVFYQNIHWLVNATEFKDHIKTWSLVKFYLTQLDEEHQAPHWEVDGESEPVQTLRSKLADTNAQITALRHEFQKLKDHLIRIGEFEKDIPFTFSYYLKLNSFVPMDLHGFKCDGKEAILLCRKDIDNLSSKLNEWRKWLSRLKAFPNCDVAKYEHYKVVDFDHVNSKSFSKCLLISRESRNSLFPEIVPFRNENEFNQTAKSKNYILVMDPTSYIRHYNEEIEKLERQIASLKLEEERLSATIKESLVVSLVQSRIETETSIANFGLQLNELEKLSVGLEIGVDHQLAVEEGERAQKQLALEESYQKERTEVMRKYKGRFRYDWLYRRKTWDFATGKVFLDFDDHIVQLINPSLLRKLDKQEFIGLIMNWSIGSPFA